MNDQIQSNEDVAAHMACMAYQLFQPEPETILPDDEPFPMFSYDRIVRKVLSGMILNMLERGFTNDEIIETIQSKQVRHILDDQGDQLVALGKKLGERLDKADY